MRFNPVPAHFTISLPLIFFFVGFLGVGSFVPLDSSLMLSNILSLKEQVSRLLSFDPFTSFFFEMVT